MRIMKLNILPTQKEKSLKLAKQARGTLDTVIAMIEDNVYCPEIIQQTDSVMGPAAFGGARSYWPGIWIPASMKRIARRQERKAIRELMKIYRL